MSDADLTALERELAQLVVSALMLEDVSPESIKPGAPLFSAEDGGLGLDSIDALELAMAVQKSYGVKLSAEDERNRAALRSISSLAAFIAEHRS